jgi:hypothetical protein
MVRLPKRLVRDDRAYPDATRDPSPSAPRRVLLMRALEGQAPTDVLVLDREFTVGRVQAARVTA